MAIGEIGNILAGTFLRTIYNFCTPSIYQTVPVLETGAIFFIIDKTLKRMNTGDAKVIMIENELSVFGKNLQKKEVFTG